MAKENSTIYFHNNLATVGGGAANVLNNSMFMVKDHITMNFISNTAQYGGSIFLDVSAVMVNYDNNSIGFTENDARILGDSIYQDVTITDLCNKNCITDRVVGFNTEFITTPPNELKFYDPAICIDGDDDMQCNSYYVKNIMPGSDIIIPSCVLDYFNKSVDLTQFFVQSEFNSNYLMSGPRQVLIDCDSTFQGITILSNLVLSKSLNLSLNITLNINHNPNWKQISVTLIVELSKCHPGFW